MYGSLSMVYGNLYFLCVTTQFDVQIKYKMTHGITIKPTIHEATFVASDTATLLFMRAVHEISNATFYKLFENRQPIYFQATCRMYHAIFPCAACTNNIVAVSPAKKVASCMVGFTYTIVHEHSHTKYRWYTTMHGCIYY